MSATKTGKYRLGFIGAGKLAGSVIRGLVRAKFCPPGEIIASEPFAETREKLQHETGVSVTTENAEIAEKAETIFLGVKPGMVSDVVGELTAQLRKQACHFPRGRCGRSKYGGEGQRAIHARNDEHAICDLSRSDRNCARHKDNR